VNVAVTEAAAVSETVQVVAVPLHAPLQPVKVEPVAGVAVSVTGTPMMYKAEQMTPQLIPPRELVTVPLPVPALVTVRVKSGVNVAVTAVAAVSETVQVVAVPVHAPLQPVKVEPVAGAAVSVTWVPLV
jgi:hypothetical protein